MNKQIYIYIYIYAGDGTGKFPRMKHIGSVPAGIGSGLSLMAGDYDKDGDLDFIITAKRPTYEEAKSYLFFNKGRGNFSLTND